MTTTHTEPRPLNNSDRVALVWNDGSTVRWHVYVPGADHLTASGRADTEEGAHRAAAAHA